MLYKKEYVESLNVLVLFVKINLNIRCFVIAFHSCWKLNFKIQVSGKKSKYIFLKMVHLIVSI